MPCQQWDCTPDMSEEKPCFSAGDSFLPILRHSTTTAKRACVRRPSDAGCPRSIGQDRRVGRSATSIGQTPLSPLAAYVRHSRQQRRDAVYLVAQAVAAPAVEIASHRRHRRKIIRKHALTASCRRDVEDRLEHDAQVACSRSVDPATTRQERRDQRLFCNARVAGVFMPTPLTSVAGEFGPRDRALGSALQPNVSQPSEFTQSVLDQLLNERLSSGCSLSALPQSLHRVQTVVWGAHRCTSVRRLLMQTNTDSGRSLNVDARSKTRERAASQPFDPRTRTFEGLCRDDSPEPQTAKRPCTPKDRFAAGSELVAMRPRPHESSQWPIPELRGSIAQQLSRRLSRSFPGAPPWRP